MPDRNAVSSHLIELATAKKFLFMGHVAIGDFLYLIPLFDRMKQQFPWLIIDVWTDDLRREPRKWVSDRNKALRELSAGITAIDHLYPIVSSKEERAKLISRASMQGYDTVLYLASGRAYKFACAARRISPDGKIIGQKGKRWLDKLLGKWISKKVNYTLESSMTPGCHISQHYWSIFNRCFGLAEPKYGLPYVHQCQPTEQQISTARQWLSIQKPSARFIFINGEASNRKKSLPPVYIAQLIKAINISRPQLGFVINSSPRNCVEVEKELAGKLANIDIHWSIFSAKEQFMMLPAMISQCDLVITVDTSTIHIALGQKIPQIALMKKSSERCWAPFSLAIIHFEERQVEDIEISDVVTSVDKILPKIQSK